MVVDLIPSSESALNVGSPKIWILEHILVAVALLTVSTAFLATLMTAPMFPAVRVYGPAKVIAVFKNIAIVIPLPIAPPMAVSMNGPKPSSCPIIAITLITLAMAPPAFQPNIPRLAIILTRPPLRDRAFVPLAGISPVLLNSKF